MITTGCLCHFHCPRSLSRYQQVHCSCVAKVPHSSAGPQCRCPLPCCSSGYFLFSDWLSDHPHLSVWLGSLHTSLFVPCSLPSYSWAKVPLLVAFSKVLHSQPFSQCLILSAGPSAAVLSNPFVILCPLYIPNWFHYRLHGPVKSTSCSSSSPLRLSLIPLCFIHFPHLCFMHFPHIQTPIVSL